MGLFDVKNQQCSYACRLLDKFPGRSWRQAQFPEGGSAVVNFSEVAEECLGREPGGQKEAKRRKQLKKRGQRLLILTGFEKSSSRILSSFSNLLFLLRWSGL